MVVVNRHTAIVCSSNFFNNYLQLQAVLLFTFLLAVFFFAVFFFAFLAIISSFLSNAIFLLHRKGKDFNQVSYNNFFKKFIFLILRGLKKGPFF
jgi:hypothetical protein